MADVSFDQHPDYLEAVYTGSLDLEEVEGLVELMVARAAAAECSRVLLDITGSTGPVSVTDRYRVGQLMAKLWDRSVRLSLVVRKEHLLPDRFWVNVTQNRGLSTNVFTDGKSAVDWLLG